MSSFTITEFVLVASVETINSSLPLAMSDLGLDENVPQNFNCHVLLDLGIFNVDEPKRQDRINVIHFYVLEVT